ncbi:MAG: penicillin-binding transpeptidase domain-containing protein [Microbacteriaceae bacterium]|nr:penicillin-binding transpeptidase domain-containing protein [Microbacteriaceae bacterium]
MIKQMRNLTRTIFVMFLALFVALSIIQIVQVDDLRANPINERTARNSFKVERGSILVEGRPIARSLPSNDTYRFSREYTDGPMYSAITGYFSHYQGSAGVEKVLNNELSGLANTQFFERLKRIISGQEPQGSSVELTIKSKAQKVAYDALKPYEGAVVALDAKTGDILAMAHTPTYDPNLLSSNNDQEIISAYKELDQHKDKPLLNRSLGGKAYHPGSTFKLVTAAAALEKTGATPATEYPNPVSLQLPGSNSHIFNSTRAACGGGGEKVTLKTALAYSCNVQFSQIAMNMDPAEFRKIAQDFGYEQKLDVPIPVTPSVFGKPVDKAQAALTGIGQLDVTASPLQAAMVTATIANNGARMKPNLVSNIIRPNLSIEKKYTPEQINRPISEKTAKYLQEMMIAGVTEPGAYAADAKIPGAVVGGKTGTAENGHAPDGRPRPYTIWFTGYAQKGNKTVAVAVVIADGGGPSANFQGSSSDIPLKIGKQVMEAVLSE